MHRSSIDRVTFFARHLHSTVTKSSTATNFCHHRRFRQRCSAEFLVFGDGFFEWLLDWLVFVRRKQQQPRVFLHPCGEMSFLSKVGEVCGDGCNLFSAFKDLAIFRTFFVYAMVST
jgi:hypothetical protein